MLVDFGRANLLQKVRSQPDKARQVIDKMRTDGVGPTVEAVRAKLDAPIPLGYCHAGVGVEAGPREQGLPPGGPGGAKRAHPEHARVPPNLAAEIPHRVGYQAPALTPPGPPALQGNP